MTPWLSIVVPARNDAGALGRTLDHLTRHLAPDVEIIVAASGDPGGTARVVGGRARLVWPEGSTRARLMNAGAQVARGRILLFLHADSFPPPDAPALMARVLDDPGAVGGAFEHLFDEPVWSLRAITWINRVRYRITRNYYGDQGIFVRADVFRALGGYRDLALMEDLDLSQRLKRRGRYRLVRTPLRTSGRRFLARGPWRTFFFIVWLLALYTLGIDTQRYAERWRGPADTTPGSPWPAVTPADAAGGSRAMDGADAGAARRPGVRAMAGVGASVRRPATIALVGLALIVGAGEAAGLLDRVHVAATRYHEDPTMLDAVQEALERAVVTGERADLLIALARIAYIRGDVRARTDAEKLALYDRGRQAARRAAELEPRNALAHLWAAVNAARWGQTKGVVRSLFLLPEVQRGIDTVLALDPHLTPVYSLAGHVALEVPGLLGGDLGRAEAMFRTGLEQDPHFTGLRVGLAKTLVKRGRFEEGRRELQAVLDERTPTNPADWAMKDAPEARSLLVSLRGRS